MTVGQDPALELGAHELVDSGEHQVQRRIRREERQLLGQLGGRPEIVRIEQGEELPARRFESGVAGGTDAAVGTAKHTHR